MLVVLRDVCIPLLLFMLCVVVAQMVAEMIKGVLEEYF